MFVRRPSALDCPSQWAHSSFNGETIRNVPVPFRRETDEDFERDMVFLGLIGVINPPRRRVTRAFVSSWSPAISSEQRP